MHILIDQRGLEYEFGLGERFIEKWTSDLATHEYQAKRCGIPPIPCVNPGQKKPLFHRAAVLRWLIQHFGNVTWHGPEGKHLMREAIDSLNANPTPVTP